MTLTVITGDQKEPANLVENSDKTLYISGMEISAEKTNIKGHQQWR